MKDFISSEAPSVGIDHVSTKTLAGVQQKETTPPKPSVRLRFEHTHFSSSSCRLPGGLLHIWLGRGRSTFEKQTHRRISFFSFFPPSLFKCQCVYALQSYRLTEFLPERGPIEVPC